MKKEILGLISEKLHVNMAKNMIFIGTFVLLALTTIDAQNTCSDSINCINVYNCSEIMSILRGPKPLSAEMTQFIKNLQCGVEGNNPKVCCNQLLITTTIAALGTNPPDVTNHPNLRLLDGECGPASEIRVFGGNKTGIFQFPWMALIAYTTGRPYPHFRCGGTIISSRYILTAAHCATPDLRIAAVRVGDHDVSKEEDCEIDNNGRVVVCAEKYQDLGVEAVYVHPGYSSTKLQDDIALLRLNRSINFRPPNVKPICLPLGDVKILNENENATVTGWGATESGPRSPDLLQATLPLVSNEQCKEKYKQLAEIWYKQLCAGGQKDVDSCAGDSGGPLQATAWYNGKNRVIQYGVVSFGLKQCGIKNMPGVYTKVAYYMDWILNTIRD